MEWSASHVYGAGTSDAPFAQARPSAMTSPGVLGPLTSSEPVESSQGRSDENSGRRILHKKSASETFAFAAGSFLEQANQQDMYKFMNGCPLQGFDAAVGDDVLDLIEENDLDNYPLSPYRKTGQHESASPATSNPGNDASGQCSPHGVEGDNAINFAKQTRSNALDPAQLDPKRAKRIIANRQSAHKSRMKKLQYIHELEGSTEQVSKQIDDLQQEADRLRTRHTELLKASDQYAYKVTQLQQQLNYQEALNRALKNEIARLRSLSEAQAQQRAVHQQGTNIPAHMTGVDAAGLHGSLDLETLLADVPGPSPSDTFAVHDFSRMAMNDKFMSSEMYHQLGSTEGQHKQFQYGI